MEASYYDSIMEQQRLEPEFFRVGFYGRKFPFFLRVSLGRSPGVPLHRLLDSLLPCAVCVRTVFPRRESSPEGLTASDRHAAFLWHCLRSVL